MIAMRKTIDNLGNLPLFQTTAPMANLAVLPTFSGIWFLITNSTPSGFPSVHKQLGL